MYKMNGGAVMRDRDLYEESQVNLWEYELRSEWVILQCLRGHVNDLFF